MGVINIFTRKKGPQLFTSTTHGCSDTAASPPVKKAPVRRKKPKK